MKNTNKLNEQFNKECMVINLLLEYRGYTGDEKWGIATALSLEDLKKKYHEILKQFTPFILLPIEYTEIYADYYRNENKHHMRMIRRGHIFNYDEKTEELHPEINIYSLEEHILLKEQIAQLSKALNQINPIQKRRLIQRFYFEKSSRKIGKEEGVAYSSVDGSIISGIKNLKKLLE